MTFDKQMLNHLRQPVSFTVTGGGGVKLHVEESGNVHGRPLLFLHGGSQCSLCWKKQIHSELALDYRLVTMDFRGHGQSDKPAQGYADGRLWAEDIHAVIRELGLNQPVLVGWSFAGIPLLDYIREYGENEIGGVLFAGALTRLGREALTADMGSHTLNMSASLFSDEPMVRINTLDQWLEQSVFYHTLTREEHYLFLGSNVVVPAFVHQGIFNRQITNDDVLSSMTKPVRITHGTQDRTVKLEASRRTAEIIPHSRVSLYEEAGHAVFWDQPERFNLELKEFVDSIGPS